MGKLFGTDGIRGIVGENLTVELAFHVGQAVAAVLTEEKGSKPTITIGKDTRISSDMLEAALMAGICSVGGDVMPLGTIPTPAVAYLTVLEQADAGIVISASHNPYEHNGIKVFNGSGLSSFPTRVEARMEELILSGAPMDVKTHGEIGKRLHGDAADEAGLHRPSGFHASTATCRACGCWWTAPTAQPLPRRRICSTGLPACTQISSTDEPDGVNINDGCGSTHLKSLSEGVVAGRLRLGHRLRRRRRPLSAGGRDGPYHRRRQGDGCLRCRICSRHGKLSGNAIVATVMSNLGLHEYCRKEGIELVCTAVGDRHVLEKMLECGYAIGGEQSGHTIFREYATTGDGELTALQFLQALRRSGKRASELASCCPQYPQELINVAVSHVPGVKDAIMQDPTLRHAIAQMEQELAGKGRVLIRPSGTEALIRVMVEARTDRGCPKSGGRC